MVFFFAFSARVLFFFCGALLTHAGGFFFLFALFPVAWIHGFYALFGGFLGDHLAGGIIAVEPHLFVLVLGPGNQKGDVVALGPVVHRSHPLLLSFQPQSGLEFLGGFIGNLDGTPAMSLHRLDRCFHVLVRGFLPHRGAHPDMFAGILDHGPRFHRRVHGSGFAVGVDL